MKAPDAAEFVYQGVWINWQKGRIWGSTLTVTPANATLITPALAVLISIAGGQLWRLFQYALHQIRFLVSSTTGLTTQYDNRSQCTVATRTSGIRTFRKSLPLIVWTSFHLILVILASTFSSRLLSGGHEVLSRSPWCGWYSNTYTSTIYSTIPSEDVITKAMEYENNLNSIYASIQQHVDICETSVDGCSTLLASKLNFTSDVLTGSCPFDKAICHPNVAGSLSFDTGFLSSAVDLGFNALKKDRIAFRLLAQCSPLNDAEHTSGWQRVNESTSEGSYDIADARYGPTSATERNATWSAVKQHMHCDQRRVTPPYALSAKWHGPGGTVKKGTATFDPIPQLISAEADTEIIMLAFNGAFYGPVSDPWFSSTRPLNETNAFCAHQNRTLYVRDLPITSVGCTQQWQVCNNDDVQDEVKSCTAPLGLSQLKVLMNNSSNSTLSLTPMQRATANRVLQVSNGAFFHLVIGALTQSSTAPLRARHSMTRTISTALPNNQWQIEAEYWFTLLLAYVQQVSLQISTGQFAASTDYINVTRPSDNDPVQNAAYDLCQSQIILSDVYQNFNFFGLLLTLALCVVIIILGLTIEDIIGLVRQRRLQYTDHNGKQDMWTLNSDLEMLKIISELKQGNAWTRSKSGVPLAQPGCKTGIFDLNADTMRVEKGRGIIHRRTDTVVSGAPRTSNFSRSFIDNVPGSPIVNRSDRERSSGVPNATASDSSLTRLHPSGRTEGGSGVFQYVHEIPPDGVSQSLGMSSNVCSKAKDRRALNRHSTYRCVR